MTATTPAHPGAAPWDLVAAAYGAEVAPLLAHFAAEALRRAAPAPGARVLDLAAGPGTLALLAARAGAEVDALDFSEEMIALLRVRAASEGVPRVTARVGDGMALPYEDGRFDAAFSMFGLVFFPDRARGFAELSRVLRPGGRALVTSWVPLARVPLLAAMFGAVRAHLPPPAGDGTPPLGDLATMRAELTAAGFRDVETWESTVDSTVPSAADFWGVFARTTAPIVLLRRGMSPEAWARFEAEVLAGLARTLGDGPQALRMIANFGMGVR